MKLQLQLVQDGQVLTEIPLTLTDWPKERAPINLVLRHLTEALEEVENY